MDRSDAFQRIIMVVWTAVMRLPLTGWVVSREIEEVQSRHSFAVIFDRRALSQRPCVNCGEVVGSNFGVYSLSCQCGKGQVRCNVYRMLSICLGRCLTGRPSERTLGSISLLTPQARVMGHRETSLNSRTRCTPKGRAPVSSNVFHRVQETQDNNLFPTG